MVMVRKVSLIEAAIAFIAAVTIAVTGTALGLAAASFNARNPTEDAGIQLVRPLHVSPEVDRARHDSANH